MRNKKDFNIQENWDEILEHLKIVSQRNDSLGQKSSEVLQECNGEFRKYIENYSSDKDRVIYTLYNGRLKKLFTELENELEKVDKDFENDNITFSSQNFKFKISSFKENIEKLK